MRGLLVLTGVRTLTGSCRGDRRPAGPGRGHRRALGLLSRLLGFAREVVLAAAYTSGATDAFVNSLLIVNTVAAVLLYTLVTLIIPVFQRERPTTAPTAPGARLRPGRLDRARPRSGLAGGDLPEVPTAVFQLDPARAEDTEELIRIMSPALALQGFSAIFTALLQIHGRFAGPAAVGIAFNFGSSPASSSARTASASRRPGASCGAALQVILQLPQFWRLLREARARPVLAHPRLAAAGSLAPCSAPRCSSRSTTSPTSSSPRAWRPAGSPP